MYDFLFGFGSLILLVVSIHVYVWINPPPKVLDIKSHWYDSFVEYGFYFICIVGMFVWFS